MWLVDDPPNIPQRWQVPRQDNHEAMTRAHRNACCNAWVTLQYDDTLHHATHLEVQAACTQAMCPRC